MHLHQSGRGIDAQHRYCVVYQYVPIFGRIASMALCILIEKQNGEIKRKFLRFYKKQFQWDLFKKLFIVPLCVQFVFRALVCRIIDPNFQHPSFFTFFSAILFSASHYINYYKLNEKYGQKFALKTSFIQATYNLIFGLYISHIFARQRALIASLVLQVYANFLGYPQYFQILKGNIEDQRVQKSALFYLVGAIGCLSCCLLI